PEAVGLDEVQPFGRVPGADEAAGLEVVFDEQRALSGLRPVVEAPDALRALLVGGDAEHAAADRLPAFGGKGLFFVGPGRLGRARRGLRLQEARREQRSEAREQSDSGEPTELLRGLPT